MLLESAPLMQSNAPSRRVSNAVPAKKVLPKGINAVADINNAVSGMTAISPEEAAAKALAAEGWANLMVAVRDHKDRAAFAQLFRHFGPRIKAFLMKSGTDAGLAEECAQEVMAVLWQKAHLFDPARASVATWVFTIARNRRIDVARKARRPEPETLDWGPDSEPDQADLYETAQETRRLTEALATLPEKQRALVQRAYYGDLSHSEIAAETGLPLGTIKSRIRLALDRLRQTMT